MFLYYFFSGRFSFSTPFTKGYKAHGELEKQYKIMKKTILITEKSFSYVKRRLVVVQVQKSELNPLEVAILNMDKKMSEMKKGIPAIASYYRCNYKEE